MSVVRLLIYMNIVLNIDGSAVDYVMTPRCHWSAPMTSYLQRWLCILLNCPFYRLIRDNNTNKITYNNNKHKISTETCEDCISRNTCSNLLIFFATDLLRSSAGPETLFSCYFFTFPVITNSASKSISHSLCSQLLKI